MTYRKTVFAALFLLAVIGSQFGQGRDQLPNAAAPVGPQILNAADIGVVYTNLPSQNRINLQAAYDKLDAAGGGTIVFGAGPPIYLDRGIMADSNFSIGFKGQGPVASCLVVPNGHNGITTGIKRSLRAPTQGYGFTLSADQFVDLSTVGLDSTAVTGPNQRFGFQTRNHTNIVQQGGPWDLGRGDGYRSARVLTLSLLLNFANVTDAQWNQMSVWGMSIRGVPCPVGLAIIRGQFFLMIGTTATTDPFADLPVVSNYWIGKPAVPRGLCRLHVQIDLDAAKVLSWVDNVQAAVTPQNTPLKPGRSFNANRFAPCGFGSTSENAASPSDWNGGPSDIGLFGAKIADQPVFVDTGVGTTIRRIDGQNISDAIFFDAKNSATIATLPLTDKPADVIATRQVTTAPSGVALALDFAHKNNLNTTGLGPIENIQIRCLDPKYGCAVAKGLDYFFRVEKCKLSGGARGIGSYNLGANYPVTVIDTELGGADAPIALYFASQVSLERLVLSSAYRDGIRLYRCGDATLNKVFSPNYGTPDFAVMAAKSCVDINGLCLDNESNGQGCQMAAVYLSPDDSVPFMHSTITNLNDAGAGPQESTVMLDDSRSSTGVGMKLTTKAMRLWNPQAQKSVIRVVGTPSRWTLDCEQACSLPIPWIEGPTTITTTTQNTR